MSPHQESGKNRQSTPSGYDAANKQPSSEPLAENALQDLTSITMLGGMPLHSPELLFGTEADSQVAIGSAIRSTLDASELTEYEAFEKVREHYIALVARFERQAFAVGDEFTFDTFQNALEGEIEVRDSLVITAFESALSIRLSHL